MKNLKLKISAITIASVIIFTSLLIIGCSKQDNKETSERKEQKMETNQQQNNKPDMQSDKTIQMDHNNMGMNTDNKDNNIVHKMINIPTAQCDVCKENISRAIKKVKGVKSFEVDVDSKIVHINFDKTVTDLSKIENAITMVGYDANNKKADPDAYAKLDKCCKKPEDR